MVASTLGQTSPASPDEFAGREQLRASSAEFRKEVIEITDGVFAAVGYSASNVTLIQGEKGSIIVDTSANPVDAKAIVDAFGNRFVRPVLAIMPSAPSSLTICSSTRVRSSNMAV